MENQKKTTEITTNSIPNHNKDCKKGSTKVPALFVVFGYLLIGCMILISLPAPVARLLGYETYNIVSGSMEPEIPVGSAVFIEPKAVSELSVGDVVAYRQNEFIVVHRLIAIDETNHEVHTKGDANAAEDLNPIPYQNVIGKYVFQIPGLGKVLFLYTTSYGKMYVISFLLAGFMLVFVGTSLKKRKHGNEPQGLSKDDHLVKAKYKKLRLLSVLVGIAFFTVIGIIVARWLPYYQANRCYEKAVESYVTKLPKESVQTSGDEICPISVDFAALQKVNPEVIGWIYCEDTVIDYPICQTTNNDFYLKHGYDKEELKSGAIFMEAENASDFWDCNTILYGHHMKNGSMFASLSNWQEQDFYESHPVMWLLTPNGNFRIDLFAGFVTAADSSTYTVFQGISEDHRLYVMDAVRSSYFRAKEDLKKSLESEDSKLHTIVLSTCDYTYQNARFVLYGTLTEVP